MARGLHKEALVQMQTQIKTHISYIYTAAEESSELPGKVSVKRQSSFLPSLCGECTLCHVHEVIGHVCLAEHCRINILHFTVTPCCDILVTT